MASSILVALRVHGSPELPSAPSPRKSGHGGVIIRSSDLLRAVPVSWRSCKQFRQSIGAIEVINRAFPVVSRPAGTPALTRSAEMFALPVVGFPLRPEARQRGTDRADVHAQSSGGNSGRGMLVVERRPLPITQRLA